MNDIEKHRKTTNTHRLLIENQSKTMGGVGNDEPLRKTKQKHEQLKKTEVKLRKTKSDSEKPKKTLRKPKKTNNNKFPADNCAPPPVRVLTLTGRVVACCCR